MKGRFGHCEAGLYPAELLLDEFHQQQQLILCFYTTDAQ
jgi:hypothetical protein